MLYLIASVVIGSVLYGTVRMVRHGRRSDTASLEQMGRGLRLVGPRVVPGPAEPPFDWNDWDEVDGPG